MSHGGGGDDMAGERVQVEVVGTHHRSSLDIRAAVVAVVALGDEDSLVVVVLVDILAVEALICIIITLVT